jgi:tetratricopeptide (TPR) repeat protein
VNPLLFTLLLLAAPSAKVNPAMDAYAQGKSLFEAGEREQALVEFRRSYELSGNVEALFGVAQSEYHLGRLKDARQHYQQYIDSGKGTSEGVQIARLRVEAINRRGGVINIQTVPVEVNVTIEAVRGGRPPVTGQAPNSFQVERGDYKVTASKDRYVSESITLSIDSGETKPLFFALEQKLGGLEIRTAPPDATLYVRGNRARNPYIQEVNPGAYELYAEAIDYAPRTETYVVNPGERRRIDFRLDYVQRSGRPELIGFWTAAGAVGGGMLVAARLTTESTDPMTQSSTVAESTTVIAGGALVGGVAGALGATAFVPGYIRDNLALFRIGTAWIGAVEGATLALAYRKDVSSAWIGGAGGLALGAVTGVLLDDKAPNYGRVAIIQSGAALGALAGALAAPASIVMRNEPATGGGCVMQTTTCKQSGDPTIPPSWGVFGGLNVGLAAGLALAYLPDQTVYGPSWQHVMLVDLATAAGAIGGAVFDVLGRCIQESSGKGCRFETTDDRYRRRVARSALIGGTLGLAAGLLLTRSYDEGKNAPPIESSTVSFITVPTLVPVDSPVGARTVPGVAAGGRF